MAHPIRGVSSAAGACRVASRRRWLAGPAVGAPVASSGRDRVGALLIASPSHGAAGTSSPRCGKAT